MQRGTVIALFGGMNIKLLFAANLLLGVVACSGPGETSGVGGAGGAGGSGGQGGAGGWSVRGRRYDPRCFDLRQAGVCDADKTRYEYDTVSDSCSAVPACDGTQNQFDSQSACEAACVGAVECPGGLSTSTEPCQAGANCAAWNIYAGGYWGGCSCTGEPAHWQCAL